jgi:hypothetical protein
MGLSRTPPSRAVLSVALVALAATAVAARPRERPEGSLAPSTAYAGFVMSRVSDAAGLHDAPYIYRAPVAAAHAVFVDGREAIVYNPRFLDTINERAGTSWAAVSVIAHELGHHFYGHAHEPVEDLPPDVLREHELEADYFSGYVLARMGASREDAEAAQEAFFASMESPTHPDSYRRIAAISAGWTDGEETGVPSRDPARRLAGIGREDEAAVAGDGGYGATFPSGRW